MAYTAFLFVVKKGHGANAPLSDPLFALGFGVKFKGHHKYKNYYIKVIDKYIIIIYNVYKERR